MIPTLATHTPDKLQQAYQYLIQCSYEQAVCLYEQIIQAEPENKSCYCYLGLALLLQGKVAEAQTTWLIAMMEDDETQAADWTQELTEVLIGESVRREAIEEYSNAEIIRQQIKEFSPTNISNLLHLVQLIIQQEKYISDELIELEIITLLQSEPPVEVEWEILSAVLQAVLDVAPLHPSSLSLAEVCLRYIHEQYQADNFINILVPIAINTAYSLKQADIGASYLKLGLKIDGENRELLFYITGIYYVLGKYQTGIETAKLVYSLSEELPDIVFASSLILKGLVSSGGSNWQAACVAWEQHESLLKALVSERSLSITPLQVSRIFNINYFTPYFQDNPREYRILRNQLAEICQNNLAITYQTEVAKYQADRSQQKIANKKLKIGYLSHCLRSHSVGWLTRWLIKYHDRERFDINAYLISCEPTFDPLHDWYLTQFDHVYKSENLKQVTEQIYQDEIDILVDLDSITLDLTCGIIALKPAPIQVTWLGWDASGIPAIDYFIADPYVLPESADEYYREKIWRLPQTYIAVDGFEVGVPTLRRDDLNIPTDAVVYFSGQRGFKRHPDTARLQMNILKEVPNSYFLIKGDADEEYIKSFFYELATEVGVEIERLRFLPGAPSEAAHRANLGIADVVLDTYPYNGATTTLETLWMGIPLVTRVGEQFAARNSYTMMINAGITEGIAWTDAEYVEWGVRLGNDENLRQQIARKLKASRRTSPLWNGKQFAREMEKAYEQMWQKYIGTST
ncbi:O-linked N-acetylglucosamine transferase, SPINDLY family protein [Nostoc piscinale CENA21]|uniref:O-linked N-acetylglucosamine transferase, SPINDLY family protein n=1 Tax=Nostoc piscinale CENA21 TaxID=224013 RepID=A0A0M5TIG4_9NOSO|nr:O-linked N-acetylglucosamine transferase, SPINDLY family protein [Nostoc piscinale]ALF52012.1 O-linked N-acetylglucosamine transferase, SPINDLY family protein [Nostoc piscinale CENA21]